MAQLAATGIANAMANVGNLVNLSTGDALATTPGGNGTVPQAEINTLANILATCINASGRASKACVTLFNAAQSDGASGTAPTDTAAAAINIAHNVTQNVSTLYGLQSPPEPYAGMRSQPNDFSLAISFGGGGASTPRAVSIDASGNVWGVSSAGVVNAYSPLGVPFSPNGIPSATTNALNSLTIDAEGDIWVQDVNGVYTEFGPTGGVLSPSGGYAGGNSGSSGLTTDSFGYFWSANSSDGTVFRFDPIANTSVANYSVAPASMIQADSAGYIWLASTNGTLYKLNQAGATVATYSSLYQTAAAMTADSANSVYVDDSTSKQLLKLAADGTQTSFSDGVGGGHALAVDGANNIWSASSSIDEHSSAGANLLQTNLQLPAGAATTSMAVDGSGDLWVADTTESGQPGAHYTEFLGVTVPALTPVSYVTTHGTLQNALNLTIGFNGPDVQFPYMDRFYAAQSAYYQSIGSSYPAGGRYCHAYLSWDIAEQAVGSGPVGTEGSRSWFEDWLAHAQGHCDRALVTFKYIANITKNDTGTYPSPSEYETAVTAFLNTDWSYTGWAGVIDFTPWNEPQNGAGSGDGLTKQIPAENAADYYLALRKHCLPSAGCTVAAGDFGSNGQQWQNYLQNCTDDSAPLCTGASYMDQYKHWIVTDASDYGFTTAFRPEVFAYHGWDDINNYINSGSHCTDPQRCTVRALLTALSDGTWSSSIIWDTEVAAGQNPQSNPDPITQACAASYLLDLTASVSSRITRIYWTQPYVASGNYFSMFDSSGNPKPSFTVVADRNIAYVPPSGSTCP
jgi:sugar lactone lactonase YvrE